MNPLKGTEVDGISIKLTKTASKIVNPHLPNAIKQDKEINSFSEFAKVASAV